MTSTKLQKKSAKDEKLRIKSEKRELFPISHYVDDRVELTKQIFSSLKGKTIRNLAPKFLKESSIDEIEELCLNELLGLSKKRLLAIINATKCPTDTESSSDSDVHNIEDHISLEEISSESEAEKGTSRPKKAKKNRTSTQKQKDGANDKGVSVLELLELQARARAIRSQLALEPVAKIEVDSDDSNDEKLTSVAASHSSLNKKEISKCIEVRGSGLNVTTNGTTSTQQKGRIKLKRNFRKRSVNNETDSKFEEDRKEESTNKSKCLDETVQKDEIARSPSPDVITIMPSPELLCISDSSDEDDRLKTSSLQSNLPNKELNVELNYNEGSAPGADESCIHQSDENLKVNEKHASNDEDEVNDPSKNSPDEIEDGEIVDGKEVIEIGTCNDTQKSEITNRLGEKDQVQAEPIEKHATGEDATQYDDNNASVEKRAIKSEMLISAGQFSHSLFTEIEKRNDDVISLGNEDLDDDLHENKKSDSIEADISSPASKSGVSKCIDNISMEQIDSDIITLDNSSDEESTLGRFADGENQSQSWNCRWLKSDRVNKILATSRLGNRVREKVKQSKKTSEPIDVAPASDLPTNIFQSQFEDGSVQQYAEILDRKS